MVAVLLEPGRPRTARQLLGAAAHLAQAVHGRVAVLAVEVAEAVPVEQAATVTGVELGSWGADELVTISGSAVEEDIARAIGQWIQQAPPWAVLAPGTLWGREVAAAPGGTIGRRADRRRR